MDADIYTICRAFHIMELLKLLSRQFFITFICYYIYIFLYVYQPSYATKSSMYSQQVRYFASKICFLSKTHFTKKYLPAVN